MTRTAAATSAGGTPSAQDPAPQAPGLSQAAAALAYAGALPLIAAAILAFTRDDLAGAALRFMVLYGGVLIVFFGGVRWGIAVMRAGGPGFSHLIGAVIPALLGLPVILAENTTLALGALLVLLPVLLLDDLRATKAGSGAPGWYLGVRVPLTVMMELALAAGLTASLA